MNYLHSGRHRVALNPCHWITLHAHADVQRAAYRGWPSKETASPGREPDAPRRRRGSWLPSGEAVAPLVQAHDQVGIADRNAPGLFLDERHDFVDRPEVCVGARRT